MSQIDEKIQKRRRFWVCYGAVAATFLLVILIFSLLYPWINYKGNKLRLVKVEGATVEMVDQDGNHLVATSIGGFDFTNKDYTITYRKETMHYQGTYQYGEAAFQYGEEVFIFSNGKEYTEVASKSYSPTDLYAPIVYLTAEQVEEKDLMRRLDHYYSDARTNARYIGSAFAGCLILFVGLWLFFYPVTFWRWNTSWIVKGGEPTDWAIFSTRAVGIGIIGLVFYFFIKILGRV